MSVLWWLMFFTASLIVANFLLRGLTMHFASHPWAQGLAAVTHA